MTSVLLDDSPTVVLETRPDFTIVIPTRNEAANVAPLLDRLRSALAGESIEVLFVDDSDDDTPEVIRAQEVRLLHRPRGQRAGGLSGAVVAGITNARAPWVIVMDGDLQHPPEVLPALIAASRTPVDLVVASRYTRNGSAAGLGGRFRRLVSRASGNFAKLAFPRRLARVTDPMSGFFAVRRSALDGADLRPIGYKILLEVAVRTRISRVAEVGYTFQPREAGASKASLREGLRFGRHLVGLRLTAAARPTSELARAGGFAAAVVAGRRSVQTRFALAVFLTLGAFPTLVRGGHIELLIPLAAGGALLVGRLKAADGEPKVHDRQVDGLIATVLLLTAFMLAALAPQGTGETWIVLAMVSFLAAAIVLLLGTRTAARLRWALVLPLVATQEARPGGLVGALVPVGGTATFAALLCLVVAGLSCYGASRRLLARLALGLPAVVLVGFLLSTISAAMPASDAALAGTVAGFAWWWSRGVAVPRTDGRHYVPRGRLALAALAVVALALGVPGSPVLSAINLRPAAADAHEGQTP